MLQKKKLKTEFCGCSDTRRAFSRACIAKCAYHKPSLSRRMGAALPLRPCGSATRRRPSRRGPQRPWGHRAGAPPPGERASGGKAQTQGKKGISSLLAVSHHRVQNAARLLLVRGPPFRDARSSSRPEGPNALGFIKRIGLVRPEMALDRAPRGLTRRCRRRFHFFVAPRSALGAFVCSAHGAPACSLLSERILSEMKQQQQQQQQQQQAREALQDLHNKHAREEERQPPCKRSCCITRSFSCSSSK